MMPIDLKQMKARCDAATAGPWRRSLVSVLAYKQHVICNLSSTMGKYELEESNAEFIAHARMDVPNLIRENEELRAQVEHFWTAVAHGWDIESRDYFERQAVAMGFKSPVEMAVHWMWKRHAKEWPSPELAVLLETDNDDAKILAFAIQFHRTVEDEYGCPGPTCPGVKRLVEKLRALKGVGQFGYRETDQTESGDEAEPCRAGRVHWFDPPERTCRCGAITLPKT